MQGYNLTKMVEMINRFAQLPKEERAQQTANAYHLAEILMGDDGRKYHFHFEIGVTGMADHDGMFEPGDIEVQERINLISDIENFIDSGMMDNGRLPAAEGMATKRFAADDGTLCDICMRIKPVRNP